MLWSIKSPFKFFMALTGGFLILKTMSTIFEQINQIDLKDILDKV